MEYYVLEDNYTGNKKIFKNIQRAKEEMLRCYLEDNVINDICQATMEKVQRKCPNISEEALTHIKQGFDTIKTDISTCLNENYIESFTYLYSAEVID